MSVQSGRPRWPRASPLAAIASQSGVSGARAVSDITDLLGYQAAERLFETIKFLVEIDIAAHGSHGSRDVGTLFAGSQPDPYPTVAHIEHGEDTDYQEKRAQVDSELARTAGHLEYAGLHLIEAGQGHEYGCRIIRQVGQRQQGDLQPFGSLLSFRTK